MVRRILRQDKVSVLVGSAVRVPLGIEGLDGDEMRRRGGEAPGTRGRKDPVMGQRNDGVLGALQVKARLHFRRTRGRVGGS